MILDIVVGVEVDGIGAGVVAEIEDEILGALPEVAEEIQEEGEEAGNTVVPLRFVKAITNVHIFLNYTSCLFTELGKRNLKWEIKMKGFHSS